MSFDDKEELVDEDTLECGDIVLLIKHQHCFFVVYRIHYVERNRAMAIGDENTVAHYPYCALVAVSKYLNETEQDKRKKSFLVNFALSIDIGSKLLIILDLSAQFKPIYGDFTIF